MRIGLDAHILGKSKGGVERVVHQMVALLPDLLPSDDFVVFINRRYAPTFPPRRNVRYQRLVVSDPMIQRSILLPWLVRRERLDLLHVQRATPPLTQCRVIVHTHDLLPLTAPQDHRGLRDRIIRTLTPRSLRQADCVLTVSNSVAEEIRRLFPKLVGKIAVVPNGIDGELFRPKPAGSARGEIHTRLHLQGDYFLYLGALMSRKNLEVVIRGFASFVRHHSATTPPPRLVLAGMSRSDAYVIQLKRLAAELAPGTVRFSGLISDPDCVSLLQHAAVFLAPSRGEGFDLPALEAMSCAIPVVCSDIPVHREMLGRDAAYFSTHDAMGLASALEQLRSQPHLRRQLSRSGPERAACFSWGRAMGQLAELYQNTVSPFLPTVSAR